MLQPNTGAEFFIFIRNFALAFSIYNEITPFNQGKNLFSAAFPIHKAEPVMWLGFLI